MADDNETRKYDPNVNYDEATMAFQREIEKKIAEANSLIGSRDDFSCLEKEYESDTVFQGKIKDLKSKYSYMRRTRGDGNCFFRAFGFSYMEQLLTDCAELNRFKDFAAKSKDDLVTLGFPQFTIEDFHDTFMEVIEKVEKQCTLEELLEIFNDQGYSDYLVVYLRLLVSGHLQRENDFFSNFVDGGRTVKEFCNQEVEPMGKESDHIHIIAITGALNVPIRVEYMDRGSGHTVTAHDFPEGSQPKLFLLYKPGHYDLLYK